MVLWVRGEQPIQRIDRETSVVTGESCTELSLENPSLISFIVLVGRERRCFPTSRPSVYTYFPSRIALNIQLE